ncbi:MAG TPA: hypothetical protein VKR54_04350 [Candidatus Babeliales bacterium]|nr:hypothetical protein [Candidatus Babeliales bacterium]
MTMLILLVIFSFFQSISADQASSKNAERVLNLVEYTLPSPSIIGDREWKELQLDRLVTIADRTKTSFGRWGLVQLLHPIADKRQLMERKEIITFLIDHPEKMNIFQQQLEEVKRVEKSLLAYWDARDLVNQQAEQFYFSVFGLKELNKSSLALNVSTAMEMFNSWKYLLTALAFGGLSAEYSRWIYSDQKNFDWSRGLREGFALPISQHYPGFKELEESKSSYGSKDYLKAFGPQGSWGDRYNILYRGFKPDALQLKLLPSIVPGFGKVGAFVGATIPTLFFDYQFVSSIFSVGRRIIAMNRELNQLQERVADVAHCIDAIIKLRKLIISQGSGLTTYFNADDYDDELKTIAKKLLSQRFLQKPGYLYSRGHVLTMHKEIKQAKKSLIPLLHSVGLLDAYCSIAQFYKENQAESVGFCFPEFMESDEPFLNYKNAWLPLLSSKEVIVNDLALGDDAPGKMLITGPNGGGKSTILKAYGVAAVLSQSWGIVPAQYAQQTLFASIRTGLAPEEDLEKKLSKGTAARKIMLELLDDIRSSDEHDYKLVLIDEPYLGTVDDESAKRIYKFGKDIADFPESLVVIATHVKKPILLEHDTGGIFGNYQVKVKEVSPGIFERLFKIEKGPALWWFEDEDKRGRFIDWSDMKGERVSL